MSNEIMRSNETLLNNRILLSKLEELIEEFKKILDDKNYASGMFFGYVFNEIVNYPLENVEEATSL